MTTQVLPVRTGPDSANAEGDWVDVQDGQHPKDPADAAVAETESMPERITRVTTDEKNLFKFYNIKFSDTRSKRLKKYYSEELEDLFKAPFDTYSQEDKVDFLLLRNYLRKNLRVLELDRQRDEQVKPVLPFVQAVIDMVEARQHMVPVDSKHTAMTFNNITKHVLETTKAIQANEIKASDSTFSRAVSTIDQLRGHVDELYGFYSPYDPLFPWWCEAPKKRFDEALDAVRAAVEARLAERNPPGSIRAAVEPIGRDGLLNELEAEMIPYTPEELLKLAKEQYDWCEKEMKKAARSISTDKASSARPGGVTITSGHKKDAASSPGFGDDWRAALEYVKNTYVEPGEQPELVRQLARQGEDFVKKHDLVTVPDIASETWRMFMISAERQKESPFFLGGPSILVSYPTATMDHDLKMMVMRGNNPHFSHATAFHELVPGHRLQLFMGKRHHPYRTLFTTPFFVEGWAMYWEFVFWNRGDFFVSPEDRIGTLFWRMHRCARIIFSLRYHLGEMTPQECVDLLVDWVGHERSNAEGEVTRSFGGDYSPLYQAGYMLGAFQMHGLREEVLSKGLMREKELHDRILRANTMPIELLRALLLDQPLSPDYSSKWRFYG
ncbi:x-pro dipeptidyl-peptidase [Colletotrichum musicola]|uniref:X-pro dipeptidyl-peptidase n=1 Tax=Colletotrichum musicola TaxID=2175873 RepID=A0A8H6K993_9PEZI|nr:x-pro dipeptidyl-peptidase [Colletotrichum musicola]